MKLRCPSCGAVFSLDLVLAHEGAREALIAAFDMDKTLGKALIKYLALFRPKKRELTMDRVATLLAELMPQINAAQVKRDGIARAAPLALWLEVMEDMQRHAAADKLELPLGGHGYLFEVVSRKAAKAAGAQEQQTEQEKSYRFNRSSGGMEQAAAHLQPPKAKPKRSTPPKDWAGSLTRNQETDND